MWKFSKTLSGRLRVDEENRDLVKQCKRSAAFFDVTLCTTDLDRIHIDSQLATCCALKSFDFVFCIYMPTEILFP